MRIHSGLLLNTTAIELWPAHLLRARGNRDARALARAQWLLRRKTDGRYLAAVLPEGLLPLVPRLAREPGVDAALDHADLLTQPGRAPGSTGAIGTLPLDDVEDALDALGVTDGYADRTGLALVPEPTALTLAGFDRYRRPLWLTATAARGWQRMHRAAALDGIALDAISGYRSHAYQSGIFIRKLARGQTLEQILTVNAAPGYSEHHGGRALDIGTPGGAPAEESFEATPAFAWLTAHASTYGFTMSYPRGNPHGIVYEPWHWRSER